MNEGNPHLMELSPHGTEEYRCSDLEETEPTDVLPPHAWLVRDMLKVNKKLKQKF